MCKRVGNQIIDVTKTGTNKPEKTPATKARKAPTSPVSALMSRIRSAPQPQIVAPVVSQANAY